MKGDDDAEHGENPDPQRADELQERVARSEAAYCRACGFREGLLYLAGFCLVCHPVATALTPPDLLGPGKLRERVARGEAKYCIACQEFEGFPWLNGLCSRCDYEDFAQSMPPASEERDIAAIRTALGYNITDKDIQDKIDSHVLPYRDASRFDNHEYRGWRGFRIRLLTVSRCALPWRALPLLWVLKPDELADDVQGTRLLLVSEEDDTEQGVVLALLWRKGEPGYLQGQWVGQLQRYQWDIRDAGQIAALRPEQQKVWRDALREAPKPGPKLGSRKIFANFAEFEEACHQLVTLDGWAKALGSIPPAIKGKVWKAIGAGRVTQEQLADALDISKSTLTHSLDEFRRAQGFEWRAWQRHLADMAKSSDAHTDLNSRN